MGQEAVAEPARTVRFVIPGPPRGKSFARAFGGVGWPTEFEPTDALAYEALIRERALRAMAGCEPMDGPLELAVVSFQAIRGEARDALEPEAFARFEAAARSGAARPAGKPHVDNLVKAVVDGMEGAVLLAPGQVVSLKVEQHWGEPPRVEVACRQWRPASPPNPEATEEKAA